MALGTDVPVVFCNDDDVAAKLHALSGGVSDQVNYQPCPALSLAGGRVEDVIREPRVHRGSRFNASLQRHDVRLLMV